MAITDAGLDMAETAVLLARARSGEAAAYCRLAQEYEARLLHQALALCRDWSTAEDLTQQTLIEAWHSLRHYDNTCRFSTWLYAILMHRFQKWLRHSRSRPVPLASLPCPEAKQRAALLENAPVAEASPSEAMEHQEGSENLRECLEALPEKHRQVIWLRFFAEASLTEIASILHCSPGTVKSRLHHALEKLRKMKKKLNLDNRGRDT